MAYAVILYFDTETSDRIDGLIRRLVENGANPYMLDHEIPPHITLSMFEKRDGEGLKHIVEGFSRELSRFEIRFASIGIFNPQVIFLSPVMTESLIGAHRAVYGGLSRAAAELDPRYVPDSWVPHVSLGIKLVGDELIKAFGTVQREFEAFGGAVTRIALVESDPYYIELARYDL